MEMELTGLRWALAHGMGAIDGSIFRAGSEAQGDAPPDAADAQADDDTGTEHPMITAADRL